jgi:hypothetical protein
MTTQSPKEKQKKQMGDRLTSARESAGFKNRIDAVRKFRWNGNTYKSHEYGIREFSIDDAKLYGSAYGVSPSYLLMLTDDPNEYGEDGRPMGKIAKDRFREGSPVIVSSDSVAVHGESAGGVWREGEDRPIGDDDVLVPANPQYPSSSQYSRRLVGNSISNRIPDGEYAIMMHYDKAPAHLLKPGVLVDVQRVRAGLREHTIKVFAGGARLMTDSRELDQQEELILNHDDEDTTVTIVGIVVGSYRPQI